MFIATISRLFFLLFVGFISGFIALLSLEIISFLLTSFGLDYLISSFYINEVGEEVIKIAFIFFVLNIFNSNKRNWAEGILNAFLVGFGFGLFEIVLIFLSNGIVDYFGIILIVIIHSFTAIFLGIAVLAWKFYKNLILFAVFLIIAIIIHIVYNLFALNFY
ncbi:MAG: hypothetical protein PF549_00825 [Patescibacteria group bacterium]|jgi:hypothetical protein|nr:hypothetical protein [Patescibacteria group bacterium]